MKSFLAACGVEDSLRLVVESQSTNESTLQPLFQPFAIIGRDLRADVALNHSQVSRRHVYIQVVDGHAFWIDLASWTGTRNQKEAQKFGWLGASQVLQVGPYVIRRSTVEHPVGAKGAHAEPSNETPLRTLAWNYAPFSEVAIEFLNGPSQSLSRPVRRVLSLIGSAAGCKFRLTDPSVSRFHCSLVQTSSGLWIVDLLGHRGVIVNEVPVRYRCLVDGDIVRIGRYQVRIRCRLRSQKAGNGLFNFGHVALAGNLPRQNREPLRSKSADGMTALPSFEPSLQIPMDTALALPNPSDWPLPNVEVVASRAATGGDTGHSGFTELHLVPLVNQFASMQQQMFDQFQQAMALMVQMFGSMHRDQMGAIRAELARLRELTDEFHALKQELADRSQARVGTAVSNLPGDLSGADRSVGTSEDSVTLPRVVTADSLNNQEAERPRTAPEVPPPLRVLDNHGQQLSTQFHPRSTSPSTESSPPPHRAEPRQEPASNPATRSGNVRPAPDCDRDTVAWLHQRIMALHHERESRWQKILKLLPGMSSS